MPILFVITNFNQLFMVNNKIKLNNKEILNTTA